MAASFVYRLDDITPDMRWAEFWSWIELFRRHAVRPLLGVVPDNRDPRLACEPPRADFWTVLRQLRSDGLVEIAQHGYQHLYETRTAGLLGRSYGFSPQSEFAGLPRDRQEAKIRAGRAILEQQGLTTDVWMAPSHSFDVATLQALAGSGFGAVTDGIALAPFRSHGLIFVPQQLWRPHALPFGVWTVCLHPNEADPDVRRAVGEHLASGVRVVAFSEARGFRCRGQGTPVNAAFRAAYRLNVLRRRLASGWRMRRVSPAPD